MTATLADYWPTLCPTLPAAWDTPTNRRNLAGVTRRMAPIPRVALECRLGDVEPRLDLQQCVRREHGEPALLRDFVLAAPREGTKGEPWERLQRFCTTWADPGTLLHRGVAEIFLEYDLDTDPRTTPNPSLFLSVGDAGTSTAMREAITHDALALLLPAPWPRRLSDGLAPCFSACPTGAFVSYLGVMLGRATQALRVNVKGVRLDDLLPFLHAVGWTGSPAAIETWAGWAYDRVDRVTVCLDVGTVVYPHLGLECVLAIQPPSEPRWLALLEELSAEGLCAAANATAFVGLPDVLRPPETQEDWPAPWVAATLCAPADHFSTTERRLSHLKVTVTEREALLKGYWGAGHVWRTAEPVQPPTAHAVGPSGRSAEQARDDAIAFLLSRQSHTGRWSDFVLPAGPSDEWVTAFVAACLLAMPGEATSGAVRRAWEALLGRRPDEPGWGYNRLTPADADSTAWALRLAAGLGIVPDARLHAAHTFLASHLRADGGVTTYGERDPIRRYTRLPADASFAGWQAGHACVTAAAAPLVGAAATNYLRSQQAGAGNWEGYWWWDDDYTTALASEALPSGRERAVRWAQRRVSTTGAVPSTDGEPSPWATAWCVRILWLGTARAAEEARDRAVRWLVHTQQADGGWRASARLRVPMPGHVDAAGEDVKINAVDENRLFTTAAVATALASRTPA
ncbi:MAG: hypothetical protein ACRD12_17720 [Acidimicrobiales bacterium]